MEIIGKPRVMPYGFRFHNKEEKQFKIALRWCCNEFGDNDEKWTYREHYWQWNYSGKITGYAAIYFTDLEYGSAFKLRWI